MNDTLWLTIVCLTLWNLHLKESIAQRDKHISDLQWKLAGARRGLASQRSLMDEHGFPSIYRRLGRRDN